MTNKIEISRELAERIVKTCMFTMLKADYEELRALLAAPAVERQEPVGRVSYIGNGFIRVRCDAPPKLESLVYTSPPAPVAVLTDRHLDALSTYIYEELGSPSDWCGFDYDGARACLDKVKEMNQ